MLRKLLIALTVLSAFPMVKAPAFAQAQPEHAESASEHCDYLGLRLGPAVELNADDRVSIDRRRELLRIATPNDVSVYNLQQGGSAEVAEPLPFPKAPHMAAASLGPAPTLSDGRGEAAEDLSSRQLGLLPNGRPVSVARLYVNNYLIKVGAADQAAYRRFGEGLLAGTYCGTKIADLTPEVKDRLRPLVTYFLFDALSSGQLDDYAAWVKYSPIFKAFLDIKKTEEFLEVYGYRVAEQGARDPGLDRMDPDKLWTFAWNAAALLFHDKDATQFTDLSVYQRDGRVSFMVLGAQPISGGTTNRYGFYTKAEASVPVGSVAEAHAFHWSWMQGARTYAADIMLARTLTHPQPKLSRFPGNARHGLIVLDVSLVRDDVDEILDAYEAYYRARGFRFEEQTPVEDVPHFVEQEIGSGGLDYLIRDGHSDGDDENVMVLYPTGNMVEGRRHTAAGDDTIRIVFNIEKKAPQRRMPYADFYRLLDARFARMHQPLVFLDGSCWGIEKAWFPLAVEPSSKLIEIGSNSSVNFFDPSARNAMRRVLDGILKGQAFTDIRTGLAKLRGYRSGREDWFVLPDDRLYPQAGPILEITKKLTVEEPGKPVRPYTPDGYL